MNFLDELKTAIEYNWPTIKEGFINEIDEISKFWYLIPLSICAIVLAYLVGKVFKRIEKFIISLENIF